MRLLCLLCISILKQDTLKILLALLGIALGVGMYGATRLANSYIADQFQEKAGLIVGQPTLILSAPGAKLPAKLLSEVKNLAGVLQLRPKSSILLPAESTAGQTLGRIQLIGIDIFQYQMPDALGESEPLSQQQLFSLLKYSAGLASRELISRLRGSSLVFNVQGGKLEITELFPIQAGNSLYSSGQVLLVDLSLFQKITGSYGAIDQIEIALDRSTNLEDFTQALESLIGPDVVVEQAGARSERYQKMTGAFRLNLNFLAAISLLVSSLLILNTLSFLLVKHRSAIGILLCLGAKRTHVLLLYAAHVFMLGLGGCVLGLFLARALSGLTLSAVSSTVSELYLPIAPASIYRSTSIDIEILLSGIIATFLGACLAAGEIFRASAKDILSYQTFESRASRSFRILGFLGVVSLTLGLLSSSTRLLQFHLGLGFLPPAFFSFGIIFLIPACLQKLCRLFTSLGFRLSRIELSFAADHIQSKAGRSAIVIAAMTLAIGMLIGVSTMIYSFRQTVLNWLDTVIQADVFISRNSEQGNRLTALLPENLTTQLWKSGFVKELSPNFNLPFIFQNREIQIRAHDLAIKRRHRTLELKQELSPADWRLLEQGKACLVSESFESKFKIGAGQEVELSLAKAHLTLPVLATFEDFTSEHGVVMLDQTLFLKANRQNSPQGIALYLKPDASLEKLLNWIQTQNLPEDLIIQDNKQLKTRALEIFDNTFRLTYALQIMSLFISTLVLINALLMLFLEWKRELMMLKAFGASERSLRNVVISESLCISLTALFFALILGAILSILLVFVINKHFFGWSVELAIPWPALLSSTVGFLLLAYIIGFLCAALSLRNLDAGALRYE